MSDVKPYEPSEIMGRDSNAREFVRGDLDAERMRATFSAIRFTFASLEARVAELEAESAAKDAALNAMAGELETTKYQLDNLSKQWPELLSCADYCNSAEHLKEALAALAKVKP